MVGLIDLLHIQRQSAYLVGRDKTVVDIPLDHPSCSKQHAVIQRTYVMLDPVAVCLYHNPDRHVQERNGFGEVKGVIKCVQLLSSFDVNLTIVLDHSSST